MCNDIIILFAFNKFVDAVKGNKAADKGHFTRT